MKQTSALSISALLILTSSLTAQSWNNPAGGAWAVSTNWLPTSIPDAVGSTANFGPAASSIVVSVPAGGIPIQTGTHVTVGTINFNNVSSSSSVAYSINTSIFSGGIFLDNGSNPIAINVNGTTAGNQNLNHIMYIPNPSSSVLVTNNSTAPGITLTLRGFQTTNVPPPISSNAFTFTGTGNTQLQSIGGFTSTTATVTKNGSGTLIIDRIQPNSGVFTANGGITVNDCTVIFGLSDSATTLATINANGRFYGSGGASLNGVVSSSGRTSAGAGPASIGIFTVGSLQLSGGSLEVEIQGPSAGSGYDQIRSAFSSSVFALGNGTTNLDISFLNGYAPNPGDLFTILRHGNSGTVQTGFFANAPLDGGIYNLGGVSMQVDYQSGVNSGDVTLMVVAVPEPMTWMLTGLVTAGSLAGWWYARRRRALALESVIPLSDGPMLDKFA